MDKIINNIKSSKSMGKRKKTLLLTIVISILVLITLIGTSLAMLTGNDESKKEEFYKTGNLTVTFDDTMGKAISLNPAKPMTDEYAINNIKAYEFTITNTGTTNATYNISLTNEEITTNSNLPDDQVKQNIKYQVNNNTPKLLSEAEGGILYTGSLKPNNKAKKMKLKIWLSYDAKNELQNATYKANVTVSGKAVNEYILSGPLSEVIIDNETIIETPPEFTTTSKDRGLYKLQDDIATISEDADKKDIYYYRGPVNNNYVSFGTYTKEVKNKVYDGNSVVEQTVGNIGEEILWRIVRINADGTVTLISENNLGDANHTWDSRDTTRYNGSEIQTTLNNWYSETFGVNEELDKLVTVTEFCNDKQSVDYVNYAPHERLKKEPPEPTLICSNGNDKIRAKAGLISADEMVYAGALYTETVTDNTTYLDNKTNFWTISLASNQEAFYWYPNTNQLSYNGAGGEMAAARPVITLSADAIVLSGSGSKEDPYKIGKKE